ncbi:unnamed protein product [[Candida] boidinii]|nr:unnamed protein product [[Candida] boidinii]
MQPHPQSDENPLELKLTPPLNIELNEIPEGLSFSFSINGKSVLYVNQIRVSKSFKNPSGHVERCVESNKKEDSVDELECGGKHSMLGVDLSCKYLFCQVENAVALSFIRFLISLNLSSILKKENCVSEVVDSPMFVLASKDISDLFSN